MAFKTGLLIQTIVAWLPNPLLWVGIVFLALGRGGSAVCLGLLALPAGIFAVFDPDNFRFDFNEYGAGYYCWLASMALLAGTGAAVAVWSGTALTDSTKPDV